MLEIPEIKASIKNFLQLKKLLFSESFFVIMLIFCNCCATIMLRVDVWIAGVKLPYDFAFNAGDYTIKISLIGAEVLNQCSLQNQIQNKKYKL